MSLGGFRSVLTSLGLEPTPRELAEILWLAARLPPGSTAPAPSQDARHPSAPDGAGRPAPRDPGRAEPEALPRVPVHTTTRADAAPSRDTPPGRPVRLPAGSPVPELPLLRALRPLKRQVPSRRFQELDEEATAERSAHRFAAHGARRLVPVVRPAPERWLDVVLVVDSHATSRMLWSSLTDDVHRLLVRSGAFRQVRVRHLHLGPDGPLGVSVAPDPGTAPLRGLSELRDPSGRRLVLILTDAVAPGWEHPRVHAAVRRWADAGPVAVVQALPERLWPGTALPAVPARLRRPERTAANTGLVYTGHRRRTRALPAGSVPVPVLELTARWLEPWARLLAGAGDGGIDTAVHLLGAEPARTPGEPDRRAPRQRLQDFQATATPEAFRLLSWFSAVPLTVSVMRVVQAAMLPGSAPSLLAEVLFSGLLVPGTQNPPGPAEERPYDFLPGLRADLLAGLRAHEVDTVLQQTSRFLETSVTGAPGRVTGLVPDARGGTGQPAGGLPWARLRADVLARAGLSGTAGSRDRLRSLGAEPPGAAHRRQAGPYRLVEYLTSADFSEVFLGIGTDGLGAAVKVPPVYSDPVGDGLFRALLEIEAESLRRMAGGYAPRLLGADPRGDAPWLAMELVRSASGAPAPTLNHRPWAEHGPRDDPVVLLRLVRRLAEALHRAHSRGIVHGNLSPHAVLLVPDGLVLISWMYAQHDGRLHRYGQSRPTRQGFLPPERYSTMRPLDASFDIYGLGAIVAHELPRQWRPRSGPAAALARLIERCTAEDPRQRPTAGELLEETDRLGIAGAANQGPAAEEPGAGPPGSGLARSQGRESAAPWATGLAPGADEGGPAVPVAFDPAGAQRADLSPMLGPDHPATLAALHEQALTHWDRGDRETAITLLEVVRSGRTRVLGPDHPDTLGAADLLRSWRAQVRKSWWRRLPFTGR